MKKGERKRERVKVNVAFAGTTKRSIDISAHGRRRVLISSIVQRLAIGSWLRVARVRKCFTTIQTNRYDPLLPRNVSNRCTIPTRMLNDSRSSASTTRVNSSRILWKKALESQLFFQNTRVFECNTSYSRSLWLFVFRDFSIRRREKRYLGRWG